MIRTLSIRNFKSIREQNFELRNLNLLTGLNGMGKSSMIQSLLLLRQSHLNGTLAKEGLSLRGNLVDVGRGRDALHQSAGSDDKISFLLQGDKGRHEWVFTYHENADLLPLETPSQTLPAETDFPIFRENFSYLNAEHLAPQTAYSRSDYEVVQKRQVGTRGEYAVHYLLHHGSEAVDSALQHPGARSEMLIHQTDAWLSEISPGTRITVEDLAELDRTKLAYSFEIGTGHTNQFKPPNVGFGISYVLPVLAALLSSKPGDFLIFENPESHIHPRGQAKIGQLLSLGAQNGAQIIVETHSDHILNGVRVAVRREILERKKVNIFYFERDEEEHTTLVSNIHVDQQGELSAYPPGFLDEWNNQLLELM